VAVVFITHNPHHAFMIGDHFAVLSLGRMSLNARRDEITIDQLINEMAGGSELAILAQQLARGTVPASA
jgi:simple sugar transport system ATP-binding protein